MLERIAGPADLRELTEPQLVLLAAEIRRFLIDKVAATGGHLGPNLGVVELTLALHRVFDSPRDPIIFDTGHQCYVHKIVTGRRDGFDRLRRPGGLSGYPAPAESEHDWVRSSHASAALSYADGLAKAFALTGAADRRPVAVVGDGALTGGMCWEALNNIAAGGRPLVIVVNDNGRSYAPTVGGARALLGLPGLDVIGPVDGHDLPALHDALRAARAAARPTVVHTLTRKGMGYPPAENDTAEAMHTCGVIDPATGTPAAAAGRCFTTVFAEALADAGARRPDVVAVTAAMPGPTGLAPFQARFPQRTFDVGIAEAHAVTSAAGLAMGGLHPVVAIYSTFLNRAFDQILMDVALHALPVTLVADRAGITGPDGASHHGMWDLALLAAVPGLAVAAPRDGARLVEALEEALAVDDGPTALRFPRGEVGADIAARTRWAGLDVLAGGTDGAEVLLVAVGPLAAVALATAARLAAAGIAAAVVDPRWVLPVAPALVELAARHALVVTLEDGVAAGGVGAAVAAALAGAGSAVRCRTVGLPRRFCDHGERAGLLAAAGLDPAALAGRITGWLRVSGR